MPLNWLKKETFKPKYRERMTINKFSLQFVNCFIWESKVKSFGHLLRSSTWFCRSLSSQWLQVTEQLRSTCSIMKTLSWNYLTPKKEPSEIMISLKREWEPNTQITESVKSNRLENPKSKGRRPTKKRSKNFNVRIWTPTKRVIESIISNMLTSIFHFTSSQLWLWLQSSFLCGFWPLLT